MTLLIDIKLLLLLISDRFLCEVGTELLCVIEMIGRPKATVTAKVKISA